MGAAQKKKREQAPALQTELSTRASIAWDRGKSKGTPILGEGGLTEFRAGRSASEGGGPYGRLLREAGLGLVRLGWTALEGLGLRTLAGRILLVAA